MLTKVPFGLLKFGSSPDPWEDLESRSPNLEPQLLLVAELAELLHFKLFGIR